MIVNMLRFRKYGQQALIEKPLQQQKAKGINQFSSPLEGSHNPLKAS